jgi:hypothetical protein
MANNNDAKIHGLAEAALSLYQGKVVEINTGETATSLQFADHEVGQKHVIRGILDDAIGDGLILICDVNGTKQKVLVSAWMVVSIMELCGNGNISDIYIDEYTRRANKRKLKRQP